MASHALGEIGCLEHPATLARLKRSGQSGKGACAGRDRQLLEVCERIAFMIKVKSRGNETAEQMLRRFKKMCEKEGLTKDIKRIAYYEKPSEKRRRRIRSKPKIAGRPVGRA